MFGRHWFGPRAPDLLDTTGVLDGNDVVMSSGRRVPLFAELEGEHTLEAVLSPSSVVVRDAAGTLRMVGGFARRLEGTVAVDGVRVRNRACFKRVCSVAVSGTAAHVDFVAHRLYRAGARLTLSRSSSEAYLRPRVGGALVHGTATLTVGSLVVSKGFVRLLRAGSLEPFGSVGRFIDSGPFSPIGRWQLLRLDGSNAGAQRARGAPLLLMPGLKLQLPVVEIEVVGQKDGWWLANYMGATTWIPAATAQVLNSPPKLLRQELKTMAGRGSVDGRRYFGELEQAQAFAESWYDALTVETK